MRLTKNYFLQFIIFFSFFLALGVNKLWAEEKLISGKFDTEFFNIYNYDSTNPKNEFNENYARSRLFLKAKLHKNLSLNSLIRFVESNPQSEQNQRNASAKGGGHKSFEDGILFIQKLNLAYDYGYGEFVAGKFEARFGNLHKRKDNVDIFNKGRETYRENEKLGFANYIKAGDEKKNGRYILGLAIFTNDSKIDGTVITKRERADKNDGVPGDKRGLKSYVASIDINYDFGNNEKLFYHIAYANLAVNERTSPVAKGKLDDEESYVLSMNYQFPFTDNLLAEGFIEYANTSNFDGNIDKDTDFLTATLSLKFRKNYSILIGRYKEKAKELGTNGVDTELKELSVGYEFDENSLFKNFKILAGITRETVDSKTSKVRDEAFVSMVRYSIDF